MATVDYGFGKWTFITYIAWHNMDREFTNLSFYSNGRVYDTMKISPNKEVGTEYYKGYIHYGYLDYSTSATGVRRYDEVYLDMGSSTNGWSDNKYKIIYFLKKPHQDLIEWLTKIPEVGEQKSPNASTSAAKYQMVNATLLNDSLEAVAEEIRYKGKTDSSVKLSFPDKFVKYTQDLSNVYTVPSTIAATGEKIEIKVDSQGRYNIPSGYDGITNVTIPAVSVDTENNVATSNGDYNPKNYDFFKTFHVQIPYYEGVTSGEQYGFKYNITFGNIAPQDTSNLWIQSYTPSAVSITDFVATDNDIRESEDINISESFPIAFGNYIYAFPQNGGQIVKYNTTTKTKKLIGDNTDKWKYISNCGQPVLYDNKIYVFGGSGEYRSKLRVITPTNDDSNETMEVIARELIEDGRQSYNDGQYRQVVGSSILAWGGTVYNGSYYVAAKCVWYHVSEHSTVYWNADIPKQTTTCRGGVFNNTLYIVTDNKKMLYYNIYSHQQIGEVTFGTSISSTVGTATAYNLLYYLVNSGTNQKIYCINTISNSVTSHDTTASFSRMYDVQNNSIDKPYIISSNTLYEIIPRASLSNGQMIIVPVSRPVDKVQIIKSDIMNVTIGIGKAYIGNTNNVPVEVPCRIYKNNQWQQIQ